eukprot:SAG22_NODE_2845_length_2161_cov_3.238603_2_plen_261_part_00
MEIGSQRVLVDATWDPALAAAGFAAPSWDGASDTPCAVAPLSAPEVEFETAVERWEWVQAKYAAQSDEQRAARARFFEAFNGWTRSIRAADAASPPPLTAAQLEAFERDGAVTIDSPLSPEQLDAAERAWDRVDGQRTVKSCAEAGFVAAVGHPFFETAAKQVLRSDAVHIQETFCHDRPPTAHPNDGGWPGWREEWSTGLHIDVQLTSSDFDATPRREQLVMWLWLADATEESGAMRFLPGTMTTAIRMHCPYRSTTGA